MFSVNYCDDYDFLNANNIPTNTDEKVKYTAESWYGAWYGVFHLPLFGDVLRLQGTGDTNQREQYPERRNGEGNILPITLPDNPCKGSISMQTQEKIPRRNCTPIGYDDAGRLKTTQYSLNKGATAMLAANTYDELGRLKTSTRNGQPNLATSSTYNVRSWLKSSASLLFNQTLYYNDTYGGSTARYSTYGDIDNLTMTYAGKQLVKAEDTEASVSLSASMDFKNNSNTAREYSYDANGNLTKDLNKGITGITYNLLKFIYKSFNLFIESASKSHIFI